MPPIDWDSEENFVPLLMESTRGDFLVPPIVLDENGQPFEGYEGLKRFVDGDLPFIEEHVVKGATSADLPELDRRMARLSEEHNVPIGVPDGRRARKSGLRWWRRSRAS